MPGVALLCLLTCAQTDMESLPSLDDLLRLPPADVVADLLAFNDGYRQHAMAHAVLAWDQTNAWEAVQETTWLRGCWELLERAHDISWPECARQRALAELRDRIGPAAYYGGLMPPHVPVWRFRQIR